MRDDLVSRIRDNALDPLDFDAADEIERLRAALVKVRTHLADAIDHAGRIETIALIDAVLSD